MIVWQFDWQGLKQSKWTHGPGRVFFWRGQGASLSTGDNSWGPTDSLAVQGPTGANCCYYLFILLFQEIAAYLITFEKHEEWLTTSPKTR